MRILLTNDDGIQAPGIVALHHELRALGEVLAIAPLNVQSATSHGVTFDQPLFIREVTVGKDMRGIAVDGRPADCVKLAVEALWPERMGGRPDLVVSGMNSGANIGINVIYSGTCAAALEAGSLGLPAIAVSLLMASWEKARFDVAARHAREAIELCLADGMLDTGEVLNLNLPATEAEGPRPPLEVVPMNLAPILDRYEKRSSPAGDTYYWPTGSGLVFQHTTAGSDVEALLLRGHLALTPLAHDLTEHARLERWRERLGPRASRSRDERQ
jgi:5'-nucleotidase